MKKIRFLLLTAFMASMISCHAQKLIMKSTDAPKLNEVKEQFIGKPLKDLLSEIKPQIKTALGNPEEASASRLANISFLFVNKDEYLEMKKNGLTPVSIVVSLKRFDNKSYPQLAPNQAWTDKQTSIYGDMIILRLGVLGED